MQKFHILGVVLRSHEAYKRRSQGHVDGWVSGISMIKHEKKTAITNIKELILLDNVYLARIRIILMIDHFRALLGFVSRNQAEDYLKVIKVEKASRHGPCHGWKGRMESGKRSVSELHLVTY